jgi:hypothetical protein
MTDRAIGVHGLSRKQLKDISLMEANLSNRSFL